MHEVPADLEDPLPLLRQLIACPSVTPEDAGSLDVVAAALEPLGFSVVRQRFEGDGSYPVDNLFAVRERNGPRLLFAGHTDVVEPGPRSLWTADPFEPVERDGRIYGRGAADMKSGVAAFVTAVAQAVRAGTAERGTLALAITCDEEADSVNGTDKLLAWAHAAGHRWDFALVGEPSSLARLGDSIKIGRRGSLSARVTVTGTQGHVAYPERANNPLPVLARAAAALTEGPLDAGSAHFPPSSLQLVSMDVGNSTLNLIPASGSLTFNVRFNDLWTPETLLGWVEAQLSTVATNGCSIAIAPLGRAASSFVSPLAPAVDVLCDVIAAETGLRPALATFGGTSDARFIARYCPVVECGLVGPTMHQPDEHVLIADVRGLAAIYAGFIGRFFGPST